jgi:hypothetical protein
MNFMKKTTIGALALGVLLGATGCAAKSLKFSPLTGILGQTEDMSQGIDSAYSANEEIKALHYESMGLVDKLDYKTTILLKK